MKFISHIHKYQFLYVVWFLISIMRFFYGVDYPKIIFSACSLLPLLIYYYQIGNSSKFLNNIILFGLHRDYLLSKEFYAGSVILLIRRRNISFLKIILISVVLSATQAVLSIYLDSSYEIHIEVIISFLSIFIFLYYISKIIYSSYCPRCKSYFFGINFIKTDCNTCNLSIFKKKEN